MTEETSRRRVLACLGTGFVVGLAGCSDSGGGTTDDASTDTTEASGDDGGEATTPADGTKPLTFKLLGNSEYESEVITIESLTFVAASADAESATIEVGETVDLSEGSGREGVTVADDLAVPYGTYESVEMTVSVEEVIDSDGASVNVSGGTVSRSFTELDDEPNTIEESQFDATMTLFLAIRGGQLEAGYKSRALG